MTIEKKLLGTNPVSGEVLPEAVSFGTGDRLSRTSDLTNNSDSKTVTLSCFFYADPDAGATLYSTYAGTAQRFWVKTSGPFVRVYGVNASGNVVVNSNWHICAMNTWNHILVSFDLTNTSKRFIYLNDKPAVPASSQWPNYTNDNIKFTNNNHFVRSTSTSGSDGGWHRESNLFLDYTYRDLSVTSNRRLFIDADGKPSSTIPSNPILYLPMKDAATAGYNNGTGGNFAVNGVLATAERGPNQDNCVASNFDGSEDYLFRSSIVGVSSTKQFTFSFNFVKTGGSSSVPMEFRNAANTYSVRAWQNAASYNIYIINNGTEVVVANISNADYNALNVDTGYKQNNVSISFDLSDTNKRYVYLNGTAATVTWATYTNQLIDMSQINNWRVGNSGTGTAWWNGQLGEVYFNTVYTDLATSNPFWDSDTNRPNSVRKVIADTSVTPLIALPIIGNDAGNNLGSGGDFTVNSGPFLGARGGSEFWARSALFGDNKLLKGGPVPSNTHKITLALCYYHVNGQTSGGDMLFSKANLSNSNDYIKFKVSDNHQQELEIKADGANQLTVVGGSTSDTSTGWVTILISIDNNNTSTRHYYVDGSNSGTSFGTYTNNSYTINDGNLVVGGLQTGTDDFSSFLASEIAFVYFNESYIDFSQEVNRNKFIDQLGYPRDLTKQIEDGDIANPLVYLKMENTAALGVNSGTGGNFSYKDSMKAGSDFTI